MSNKIKLIMLFIHNNYLTNSIIYISKNNFQFENQNECQIKCLSNIFNLKKIK